MSEEADVPENDDDLQNDPELKSVLEHMNSLKGKVTVQDVDYLLQKLKEKDTCKKELEAQLKRNNKIISRIKVIATGVLKDLGREDYKGPAGSISIQHLMQVKMPISPEQKAELWAWMREKGIYDKYATVHATSLKTLFKSEMEVAKEEMGEAFDPVLFAIPGLEPATFFDDLKFTASKQKGENKDE